MKACIILGNIQKINKLDIENAYLIGADRGALNAMNQGIMLDVAIGDFDSVSKDEFDRIQKGAKKLIRLNPIKDKTDTDEALDLCSDFDEITILGGIQGKRIEHFYSILLYLKRNPKLTLVDDYSRIETHSTSFEPLSCYKYVSIFALEDTILSLHGMKYNLDHYHMTTLDPLGVSNEVLEHPFIEIHEGRILVIYSEQDHEIL